jgi:ribosome recycling factor
MDYSKELENTVKPAVESLKTELSGIRTNRPHPGLIEDIKVEYLEQPMTLKQLGSISIVPPREIDINVWDGGALPAVVKAIETSGRGLTANISGNLIRINLPTMTDERRVELSKLVKSMVEQVKIRIRSLRDDANKKVEVAFKAKILSEDQKFRTKDYIQKVVDKTNADIENLLAGKLKEIND